MRWVKLLDDEPSFMRRNSAFTLDEANHRLVVWGGTPDGKNSVNGLWFLDLDKGDERWERLDVPSEVPPRASGSAVYDPVKKRIIAGFGNSTKGAFPDTWAFYF